MFREEFDDIVQRIEEWNRDINDCFDPAGFNDFLQLAPPIEEARVLAFERRYDVRLPEDHRYFVLSMGEYLSNCGENDFFNHSPGWEEENNFRIIVVPASCSFNQPHVLRCWHQLSSHEKLEADIALLIDCGQYGWSYLILSGPYRGTVWYWLEGENEEQPARDEMGHFVNFARWLKSSIRSYS